MKKKSTTKRTIPKPKQKKRLKASDGIPKGQYLKNKLKEPAVKVAWFERRSKAGRTKLFEDPDQLWKAATEYFQWCVDNPLYEHKPMVSSGKIKVIAVPKVRAFTLNGLCLYLGCSTDYIKAFRNYVKKENQDRFLPVIEAIQTTIFEQKFSAAAADLLNANIISRDLGLIDKRETKVEDQLRNQVRDLFPLDEDEKES